jgi:hypothetical protein
VRTLGCRHCNRMVVSILLEPAVASFSQERLERFQSAVSVVFAPRNRALWQSTAGLTGASAEELGV